jgi:hypothetical protein
MTPDETFKEQLRNELAKADALEAMMRTEGWKILVTKVNSKLMEFEDQILKATTGDLAMKAATSLVIAKSVITWPEQTALNARRAAEQQLALEKQTK